MAGDQGHAYVMQDALLPAPASGVSDLLPSNTQIFSSTVRYGRPFYIVAAATVIVAFCILAAGAATGQPALLGAAFGLLALGAGVCYFLSWRAQQAYASQLRNGEWHEGVIVFSSGDVVVRLKGILSDVDTTIEAVYLSRADVHRRCAPHRCVPRNYLRIYHLGIDARPAIVTICETDLTESVHRIAEYINDLKSKNVSAF